MNSSSSEELGNMVMNKGVRESTNPPPFLTKTREMVEDPTTNSIISWNSTGTSFIIWDHLIFSKDILPQYFKHNNFSSFIYQLNNYGFKKIGLRQYEYENKWFKCGKEHLVINITRRNGNPSSVTTTRRTRKRPFFDTLHELTTENQMKADLHILRNNVCKMKSELGSLKDKIQDIQIQMIQSQQKIRQTETQTRKILDFLAQTCSPSFAQQITKLVEEELEDDQAIMEELTRLLVPRQKDEIPSKNMCNLDLKTQDEELGGDHSTKDFDARIFWKEVLEMAEEDFIVCENEGVVQVNPEQQSNINQIEFDNLLDSKMVVQVEDAMEDEVMFQLWG